MKTFWHPGTPAELVRRVDSLAPHSGARWGRLTCPHMVVHVTDALRLYAGELAAAPTRTPLQYAPLKQAVIYLIPMPRNAPTARALLTRVPGDWDGEVARLREAITSFAAHRERRDWPPHPLFGRLSCRAYGVLAYKHTDHHLRQFGV